MPQQSAIESLPLLTTAKRFTARWWCQRLCVLPLAHKREPHRLHLSRAVITLISVLGLWVLALCLAALTLLFSLIVGPALESLLTTSTSTSFSFSLPSSLPFSLQGLLEMLSEQTPTGQEAGGPEEGGGESKGERAILPHLPLFTVIPLMLCGLGAARWFLGVAYVWGFEVISEKIARHLRMSLFANTMAPFIIAPGSSVAASSPSPSSLTAGSEPSRSASRSVSSLGLKLTVDVAQYKNYMLSIWSQLPLQLFQALCLITGMAVMAPRLTLAVFVGVVPFILCGIYFARKISQQGHREIQGLSSLGQWIEQRLKGLATIKHYRSETQEAVLFEHKLQDLFAKQMQTKKSMSWGACTGEALSFAVVIVIFFLCMRFAHIWGLSSAVMLSYMACLVFLSQNVILLAQSVGAWGMGLAARESMQSAYAHSHPSPSSLSFPSETSVLSTSLMAPSARTEGRVCIRLTRASFCYHNAITTVMNNPIVNTNTIVKDFSYTFDYGQIYAITGKSGAGKSSFLRVLLGLEELTQGKLEVFQSARSQRALRCVYVPQEVEDFYMSVAQLVAFPQESYDLLQVQEALQQVDLLSELQAAQLPLERSLGFAKNPLSQGQLQRLYCARIFYHRATCVIADEPSSALDVHAEKTLISALKTLAHKEGACVIMSAHRSAMTAAADHVLILPAL